MATQQTDPTRVLIYIIEEFSDDPDIPAQKLYRKIGIASKSYHTDPLYQRTRMFHQGNIRYLRAVHTFEVHHTVYAKARASDIEKIAHGILRSKGCRNRQFDTNKTGHGEWFKVSKADAIEALEEAIETSNLYVDSPMVYDYFRTSGPYRESLLKAHDTNLRLSAKQDWLYLNYHPEKYAAVIALGEEHFIESTYQTSKQEFLERIEKEKNRIALEQQPKKVKVIRCVGVGR